MNRRSLLSHLVLLIVLLPPLEASAETVYWRTVLPGNVYSVVALPPATAGNPNVLIAGRAPATPNPGGLFRSFDAGLTWQPFSGNWAYSLCADPAVPGAFYAATNTGLVRFVNWGAAWSMLNPNIRYSVTVSPFDARVIYGDNLRSLNGGVAWQPMAGLPTFAFGSTELPHIKASRDPSLPGFMLALNGRTLYRSDNGGDSWTFVATNVDTAEIDPVDARYYFLGYCTGGSQRCGPAGCFPLNLTADVHAFAINTADTNRVYAVNGDGVFFSSDRGATWRLNARVPPEAHEGRMIFEALSGNVFLPATYGLYLKGDGCPDNDGDGFPVVGEGCGPLDCNDSDPGIYPSRNEFCVDSLDNDCNGLIDFQDSYCANYCADTDGDGHLPRYPADCGGDDCDNRSGTVYPGAPEIKFDTIDQDCNGHDLTITISKAAYTSRRDTLAVEARSNYGEWADLTVAGFGPLTWNPKKSLWSATFSPAGGKPAEITVFGPEGAESASVSGK